MNFSVLTPLTVMAGLLALAGVLYLLQQLRIRYSEKSVPTTMFWAAAVREAPVRVFRKRFRHWWAWLLSLLIVSLLWLGFAGPEMTENRSGGYHVLFLDGSAHMGGEGLLEDAVDALRDDLQSLPDERREVIWGGAYNLKILDAGEDRLLLDRRLETLQAEAAPSAVEEQLRTVSLEGAYAEQVRFVIYGRAPVSQSALDNLPAGVSVSRGWDSDPGANAGITVLGVADAASGRWDAVDVQVEVSASGMEASVDELEFNIDGAVLVEPSVDYQATHLAVLRDLPADGGVLEARLADGGALSLDDVARVRLPQRQPIGVAVAPSVPAAVQRVIESDPGLEQVTPDNADVVIRPAGSNFGSGLPAFETAAMGAQTAAFQVNYTGDYEAQTALEAAFTALGLDQVDHTGLATAAQQPIQAVAMASDTRGVAIWSELLGEGFNFTGSRSFPVFVARSIRWLAGASPDYAYLAAGRPVRGEAAGWEAQPGESGFTVLGSQYVPPRTGTAAQAENSDEWPVALLDIDVSAGPGGAELAAPGMDLGARAAGIGLVSLLILAALLLLVTEWVLYRRGLMP